MPSFAQHNYIISCIGTFFKIEALFYINVDELDQYLQNSLLYKYLREFILQQTILRYNISL